MKAQLDNISVAAAQEIASASDKASLETVRIKYLGKKGALTAILRGMGALTPEERPVIGAYANTVRANIEAFLEEKGASLASEELKNALVKEKLDVTMPAKVKTVGKLHPITQVENRMKEIFVGLGFDIVEGPEVESAYNNFDALNAPADHPSRDFQDTFYINDTTLLRTQTSPVQIRAMKTMTPPIRIISPGRVYRCDEVDATHSPMFHQLEGLVIDKNITLGDLKGLLELWAKEMFGSDTKTRFRPHNFPFTEPSAEVDVSCFVCGGKGCRLCKGEGWIELLGAGLVHPNVLKAGGIDPEVYSGLAFGMGIERVVMTSYGIDDMRHLYENDIRFLGQF
ncbi:MAG: phenylalanine--tRNA ligase subunit alpha [Clostridia bacterium]|nr:phenylalanine--tRNA ligase subunit alpha [Clostridia bacterium]MBO7215406.1 phenylalanine--tRNA ligase subunit alpha [Clostridia bacterium]MBO7245754.1 phenylalanine--tRNA ligase subunit alpha [Clostridia bacterium]MBO7737629.1 phenylalanine--tRNA ligase subunit alpha [Clostridia bacterium]